MRLDWVTKCYNRIAKRRHVARGHVARGHVARGHVAQWIEHQVPVLRVGGSNPSMLALMKPLQINDL